MGEVVAHARRLVGLVLVGCCVSSATMPSIRLSEAIMLLILWFSMLPTLLSRLSSRWLIAAGSGH